MALHTVESWKFKGLDLATFIICIAPEGMLYEVQNVGLIPTQKTLKDSAKGINGRRGLGNSELEELYRSTFKSDPDCPRYLRNKCLKLRFEGRKRELRCPCMGKQFPV